MINHLLTRIKKCNNKDYQAKGKYVLYWAQTGLRIDYNYSLFYAIEQANKFNKPLLVYFALKENKLANLRQYLFLKQGILEFKKKLENQGINFLIKKTDNFQDIFNLSKEAVLVISDFGYLSSQKYWRRVLTRKLNQAFYQVENDTVFPLKLISSKKINYAFQIRKKVFNLLPYFVKELKILDIQNKEKIVNQDAVDIEKEFNLLKIDKNVGPSIFIGGEEKANEILKEFIEKKLFFYKKFRSHPEKDFTSNLSPYLHYGFISPVKIVIEILKKFSLNDQNVIAFFNELLIWRELSRNFVYFEKNYNNWLNIPLWAAKTLEKHQKDKRKYIYSLADFEEGKTHDIYWNAAQKEMLITGKMHNYMRMYWAKKIIEWSPEWRQAYQWLVYLNDKYELDGRDPNGYAGIAWSFGQFDHPWREREILGNVRYLSSQGLERKFDIKNYLEKIKNLEKNYTKLKSDK